MANLGGNLKVGFFRFLQDEPKTEAVAVVVERGKPAGNRCRQTAHTRRLRIDSRALEKESRNFLFRLADTGRHKTGSMHIFGKERRQQQFGAIPPAPALNLRKKCFGDKESAAVDCSGNSLRRSQRLPKYRQSPRYRLKVYRRQQCGFGDEPLSKCQYRICRLHTVRRIRKGRNAAQEVKRLHECQRGLRTVRKPHTELQRCSFLQGESRNTCRFLLRQFCRIKPNRRIQEAA